MSLVIMGIIGLYVIATGAYQIVTGRYPKEAQNQRFLLMYTYDSLNKFVRLTGIMDVLIGIIIILEALINTAIIPAFVPISALMIALIVILILYLLSYKFVLKKIC